MTQLFSQIETNFNLELFLGLKCEEIFVPVPVK